MMISQWEALHKNYIELLWKFKDIAGFARSTAIDFVNIMIPQVLKNPSLNIEQKKNTLRDYMNHLEEVRGGSKSLTDSFAQLQIGVDLFCEQWRHLVKKPHFVHCITQTQEYGQRLAELDAQLKPLQFKIAALKITLCIVTATRTSISLIDNSSLCRESVCDASQSSLKKAFSRAEDEMEELQ
ncbi:unnamed protein product [Somion occarium]|uniref:Dynein heavy chain tail domain-containing protein n=1 Tax=Somion occarium TaxID=3059160 RepID=A0ABP1E6G7_9APHY